MVVCLVVVMAVILVVLWSRRIIVQDPLHVASQHGGFQVFQIQDTPSNLETVGLYSLAPSYRNTRNSRGLVPVPLDCKIWPAPTIMQYNLVIRWTGTSINVRRGLAWGLKE